MERQYLVTERAHFMCPNMHFGMIIELEKAYDKENVKATFDRMAEAHPFLKALIRYEEGTEKLYYEITDCMQIEIAIKDDCSTLWADYKKISKQDWNVFENGLLKVYIYPKERGMAVLFVAHHLLADGRGLLDIAQEFADDYVGGIAPVHVQERLIEGISDLPPKSRLSGISRMLVRQANRRWIKEKHTVAYKDYAAFVEEYSKKHIVEYMQHEIEDTELEQMVRLCKENNFTMNDLLMAHMYIKTGTEKIIIAADIRRLLPKYREGALGNYATAMGIICKSKTTDVVEKAKEVHCLVARHMQQNKSLMLVLACYLEMVPTLLDAAVISALGGFESKAAKFVGECMFGFASFKSYSITNLGKVDNKNMKSAIFIPPASPAAKLTLGVVTLNGTMTACSSRSL